MSRLADQMLVRASELSQAQPAELARRAAAGDRVAQAWQRAVDVWNEAHQSAYSDGFIAGLHYSLEHLTFSDVLSVFWRRLGRAFRQKPITHEEVRP